MLIFRQLFDPTSSTCTYLLGDSDGREPRQMMLATPAPAPAPRKVV